MIYANVDENSRPLLDEAMKQTKDKKWYCRLKIIDLSSQGHATSELAKMFDLHPNTVRDYIKRYNQGGLTDLNPDYERGRPQKLLWNQAEWLALLHQAPSQFDKLESGAQNWTQQLVVTYIQTYHQIQVTQAAVSQMLKQAGIRWKRAKLRVKSPDPLYVVKRQRLETLQQKAQEGTLTSESATSPPEGQPRPAQLVYLDSTDLHWCPDHGQGYRPVGQQCEVDSPGLANPWWSLFGSLVYPSGTGVYTIHTHKRHLELMEHLKLLLDSQPDGFFFIALDNASAHTTKKLKAFIQEHQNRMELIYLPTYSPDLNLIERLWRVMRYQVTRNHFYDSLDSLAKAVSLWLEKYPFSKFCSLMGIDEMELQFIDKPFL